MDTIPKEYLILFNAITAAEETLQKLREELIHAQQISEELYIEKPERKANSAPQKNDWGKEAVPCKTWAGDSLFLDTGGILWYFLE